MLETNQHLHVAIGVMHSKFPTGIYFDWLNETMIQPLDMADVETTGDARSSELTL